MKRSIIASGATALALGMVAVSVHAAEIQVLEDFAGQNGKTIIGESNTIGTHSNLTWSVLASGTADASVVENEKLTINTEGDTIAATIDSTKAATLNAALTGTKPEKANGEIYLDAKVKFVASDELEAFDASDTELKFALYAYDRETVTNLVIYHGGGVNPALTNDVISNITFAPDDGEKQVVVTMKDDNGLKFKVSVGGVEADSPLATEGWFPTVNAVANNTISAINIQGTGTIDDITLGYNTSAGFVPGTSNGVTTDDSQAVKSLTQNEADYLNANVEAGKTVEAIIEKVATISSAELTDARLLNLDVVETDFTGTYYSFGIKSIAVSGTSVTVTITLDRLSNEIAQNAPINGVLHLQTSADGVNFTTQDVTINNATFANGDEATVTVTTAAGPIVKATIGEE